MLPPGRPGCFTRPQTVLLYGSESWTIGPKMLEVLTGFHHKIARQIAKKTASRQPDGTWVYPPIAEALEIAGLFPMEEYIRRRQSRMVQYVATRPIFPALEAAAPSSRLRWWRQPTVLPQPAEPENIE